MMTMSLGTANLYDTTVYVKAYVQLKDGTVEYSKTESYSIFNIAQNLYENCKMGSYSRHQFLYERILKVVNKDYAVVPYYWGNSISVAF